MPCGRVPSSSASRASGLRMLRVRSGIPLPGELRTSFGCVAPTRSSLAASLSGMPFPDVPTVPVHSVCTLWLLSSSIQLLKSSISTAAPAVKPGIGTWTASFFSRLGGCRRNRLDPLDFPPRHDIPMPDPPRKSMASLLSGVTGQEGYGRIGPTPEMDATCSSLLPS